MIVILKIRCLVTWELFLGNSKQNMNIFIRELNGFYKNNFHYGGTDSLYIERNYSDVFDKAKLVGEELCQGKKDYEVGGIFSGLFVAT